MKAIIKDIIQMLLIPAFFIVCWFIGVALPDYEPIIHETTIEKFLDDNTVLRMDVEIEKDYSTWWMFDSIIHKEDKELFNKIVDRQVELIGTSEDFEDELLEALNDSFENTELTIKSVDILDITEYYKEASE